MSQMAARPFGPVGGSIAVDGSEHGPDCYDRYAVLTCGWPERHDARFTEVLPYSLARTIATTHSNGSWLDRLMTLLVVVVGVAAVGIGVLIFVAGLHFQTVTSGSMRPTISPGDVAVTEVVPVSSLRVGDAIVFYPPGVTSKPVMHRIVSIVNGVITTRGDANNVDDPWQITLSGKIAYRMVAVVPFIGWLIELQRPALIVAGLLLGLALLLEIRKEVRGRKMRARSEPQT